jgi:hypothetical protein
MSNTAAMGVRAKMTIASRAVAFVSESLKKTATIVERAGIRGTRSHTSQDTRSSVYTVGGQVLLEPTPEDLAVLLPYILGGSNTNNAYALAETLPDFAVVVDRVTKVFTYANCKVDRATISASKGDPVIKLALELAGITESVANAGTLSATLAYTPPYIFTDLVLTLLSVARQAESFTLVIDNQLVKDRHMNQTMVVDLPEQDRLVTLQTNHGYTDDNADLYAQALAGAAATLVLSQAGTNYSTTFSFGTLQVPAESPVVAGKEEVMLPLQMVARKTSVADELAVTHVPTP